MKRLMVFIACLILCISVSFAGGQKEGGGEIVITVAHVAVEGQYHPFNEGLKKMQEVLDEKTGGRIKLKIFAGGSLSDKEDEMLTMIQSGSLDMSLFSPAILSNYEPLMSIVSLPYIFRSLDHAEAVMAGEVGDILRDKLKPRGYELLAWWAGKGFRSVNTSTGPIYTPEDLKGVKIRVMQDEAYIDTFKAFGAQPVPISWGELHTALQTKLVDAHENDPQVIDKYGFIEFAKYFSLTEHTYMPIAVVIGNAKFESLSAKDQKILMEAAQIACAAARKCADDTIDEAYAGIEAQGGQVNRVKDKDAFIKVALPVIDKYKYKFGDEGAKLIDMIMK